MNENSCFRIRATGYATPNIDSLFTITIYDGIYGRTT